MLFYHGKSDAVIADTLSFFLSLGNSTESDRGLQIGYYVAQNEERNFDFACLQPIQLARILHSNASINISIHAGTWGAEQSLILATRP
jgi:hypothetical protein